MSPLSPPLFIRLSILQKLNSLSTLSENCLDNNFSVSVWAENGGEAVAGMESWGRQVGENVTRQMGMTKNWLDSIDIN